MNRELQDEFVLFYSNVDTDLNEIRRQNFLVGPFSCIRAWRMFVASGRDAFSEEQWCTSLQSMASASAELMQVRFIVYRQRYDGYSK